jgi:hypothetical protein
MEFIEKRPEESRTQYALRLVAAIVAIVVIAPVVALTIVLVPVMLVLELPPFLLAVVVGLLAWSLIRLRQGIPGASERHEHPRQGSRA